MRKYALIGDKVLGANLSKYLIGEGYSVARATLVISRGLSNATLAKFFDLAFHDLPHATLGTFSVISKGTLVEAFIGFLETQFDASNNSEEYSQLSTVIQCFLDDLFEFILQEVDLTPRLQIFALSPSLTKSLSDFQNKIWASSGGPLDV